jgi:osmotically-inducible protein OsmY
MADYKRQHDETSRRHERDLSARASDEVRAWFVDGVHNPESWGEQHLPGHDHGGSAPAHWSARERGGYWRQYEAARPHFVGRGPKGYQRSDERIREEVCDCMTEDPMLDASEIEVDVRQGEVVLCGSVSSREQKRRAEDVAERISGVRDVTNQLRVTRDLNGHDWTADSSRGSGPGITSSQPVTEASGKGTPSKSTSGTSA